MNEIIIESPANSNIDDFLMLLVDKIKQEFISSIDDRHTHRFDSYFNNKNKILKPIFGIRKKKRIIKTRDILVGAISNIMFKKTLNNSYRIFINPNALVPNTFNRYDSLISLIDKGNLEISPYSIWSDTVLHFCCIIPQLYKQYYKEDSNVHPTIR